MSRELVRVGDCREIMPGHGPYDMILADPPYGDTALTWDKRVNGWLQLAYSSLKPTGSMWVFGSMRFFMLTHRDFRRAGWRYAQDIVWEKHNGSGFLNDRFKRVHEHAVQFYRKCDQWSSIYNDVQHSADAAPRTVRRKQKPTHMGETHASVYESHDGGPRIMRSVIFMRSMHGRAIHPTEKPASLLELLVRTSAPPPWSSRRLVRRQWRWRGSLHSRWAPVRGMRDRRADGGEGEPPTLRGSSVKRGNK